MPKNKPSVGVSTHVLGFALGLTQLLFLPSAHSPFRTVKIAWVLSVLAVFVAVACLAAARRGTVRLPTSGLAVSLMALPVLAAGSALWAADPRHALLGSAATAVWVAAVLALSAFDEARRRVLVLWVAAGAAFSSLVLVAQFFNVSVLSLPGREATDRLRLIGTAGNPSDLAMAGVLLLPLLIPLLGIPLRKHKVATVTTGCAVIGALVSQSLTGWVSLGLIATVLIVTQRSRKVWLATAGFVLILAVLVAVSPLRGRVTSLQRSVAAGDWNKVFSDRTDGWSAATAMFTSRPAVGVGSSNFSREFYSARVAVLERSQKRGLRGEVSTHFEWAHNDILEILAELGLLGGVWMAVFAWFSARSGISPSGWLLAASAWLPFLFLHYPTHLAVGALPGALLLAGILAPSPRRSIPGPPIVAWLVALVVCLATWWTVSWQLSMVRLDLWRGAAEHAVTAANVVPVVERRPVLLSVEQQAAVQIARHPGQSGWIWRLIGKARLVGGRYSEAEGAFRRAMALEPHEEAAFGLGESLLAQGRHTEAVEAFGPVARMNPILIDQVSSPEMQQLLRNRLRDTTR